MKPDEFTFLVKYLDSEKEETVRAFSREDAWLEVIETIDDLGLVFGIRLVKHKEISE